MISFISRSWATLAKGNVFSLPEMSSVMEDGESSDSEDDSDNEDGRGETRMERVERRLLKKVGIP